MDRLHPAGNDVLAAAGLGTGRTSRYQLLIRDGLGFHIASSSRRIQIPAAPSVSCMFSHSLRSENDIDFGSRQERTRTAAAGASWRDSEPTPDASQSSRIPPQTNAMPAIVQTRR